MSPGVMDELRERAGRSVLLRMLFIGFLILVLQIPILTIDSTVSEREATRQGAIAEVTRTWGGAQQVAGPVLTVPYLVRSTDDKGKVTVRTAHASFLPRELDTTATIATEVCAFTPYSTCSWDQRCASSICCSSRCPSTWASPVPIRSPAPRSSL